MNVMNVCKDGRCNILDMNQVSNVARRLPDLKLIPTVFDQASLIQ